MATRQREQYIYTTRWGVEREFRAMKGTYIKVLSPLFLEELGISLKR